MSGFWSIFGALVQCYSLQPPPYETFRSHYKVASPDDASAAIRGEFPEPVYKPKDDDLPRKNEKNEKNKKNSKYTATSKSLVEKHLHVEEIKKTEKKTKLTKGWRILSKSKHNYTNSEENPKSKFQSNITLQNVANCLETINQVSSSVPLNPCHL